MTAQTVPAVPPRPSRSPHQQNLAPTSAGNAPKIPPRPSRSIERSASPLRDSFAPSPLNEPPHGSALSRPASRDTPQRPPSVTIPSLGEEGIEYEDIGVGSAPENHPAAPTETRNVGSDLKLHAPRPSLPTSSAKAQVQAVTRTDSRQAAAAGLAGMASPSHEERPDRPSRSLHSGASGSRADSSTASTDRRLQYEEEHGIPEIGQRVPMYPNGGDVQAPSPSPYQLEHGANHRPSRGHNRSRSGRESSLPPGSYGLHGHGVDPTDKFEKAWYEKHPDEYVKEEKGQYGPGVGTPKPDWALSSDDLNKLVRGSAVTGSGIGTSPAVSGTPEEEIGYIASDEYQHRLVSPPPSGSHHDSRPAVASSLKQSEVPNPEPESVAKDPSDPKPRDSGLIHVDEPYHHLHHPDGFAQTPDPDELAHEHGDEDVEKDEPILAADEVRPESAFQHPAVSPTFGRRTSLDNERSRTPSVTHSRPTSRSTSHHGSMPTLARFNSRDERDDAHTPLENVEEYEPLFPEDASKDKKPVSTVERFKQRPDLLKHRFPSQDIWEDSPNSLQLHTTVSTPDAAKDEVYETPEQESFRRSQTTRTDPHQIASQILEAEDQEHEEEQASSRPGVAKQRFPSRDIWEDVPESQRLVTTIEPSAAQELQSPVVPTKPQIPSRPPKQAPPVNASTKPVTSPTEKKQPPMIPDRPKPQIPTRPARLTRGSTDEAKDAPAAKDTAVAKDVAAKPKPAVPARPGGSKIAALKAGFLTDLNSRLQVGPPAAKPPPKKEEPPAEKVPLSDARKGRARGPARRKPAAEPARSRLPTIPEVRITETWSVWQVDADGNVVVGDSVKTESPKSAAAPATAVESAPMAPPISENAAGESTDPQPSSSSPVKEEKAQSPEATSPPASETKTLPVFTDAAHKAPDTEDTDTKDEPAPAVEPVVKEDAPEASAAAAEVPSPESKAVDTIAENLSAVADGKKNQEGQEHVE